MAKGKVEKYLREFEIPFEAQAKERARSFIQTRGPKAGTIAHRTPGRTRNFEYLVRGYAIQNRPDIPIESPMKLTATFFVDRPKKPKHALPATRPDLDNYLKSLIDGMNKVIFKDDNCICEIIARKVYTTDYPKIQVRLETL